MIGGVEIDATESIARRAAADVRRLPGARDDPPRSRIGCERRPAGRRSGSRSRPLDLRPDLARRAARSSAARGFAPPPPVRPAGRCRCSTPIRPSRAPTAARSARPSRAPSARPSAARSATAPTAASRSSPSSRSEFGGETRSGQRVSLRLEGYVDLPAHRGPGGFDHAAVHRGLRRLYVAHTANDTIDVIDLNDLRFVDSIVAWRGRWRAHVRAREPSLHLEPR